MKILITGSAGHLGEALMRTLKHSGHEAIGLDIKSSLFTHLVGSITERDFVKQCVRNVDTIVHTATLHKPHIATHLSQDFVDTNITGTLNLLEEAVSAGVRSFVFTSTTSTFGHALTPATDALPVWVTEEVVPIPKNIYGVTKLAAENLCGLFHQNAGLPCIILRTSRFFPEEDDDLTKRQTYDDTNLKVNEYLYRRVDIEDVVSAHILAVQKAPAIGFGRYIISSTTPFSRDDMNSLRTDVASVVKKYNPSYEKEYQRRGWVMLPRIDRIYVNEFARRELGWQPLYNFGYVVECLRTSADFHSPLARAVGSKGYHDKIFPEGPYPT